MKRVKNSKNKIRLIRHKRIRSRLTGTAKRPRVSVFRSLRQMTLQLIDDSKSSTICQVNTSKLAKGDAGERKAKTAVAYLAGKELAEVAIKKGVKTALFDRGGYKYHGRVKAVAEGLRDGGLQI
tara:strand:- start:98 stop:469 length:372 start_codon:yes stop_codon:yes gene_type:complete